MESALVDSVDSTRLEKLLLHYFDTINSVSFDCDSIKLTDLCSQKEFDPLDCLFERILAVHDSSVPVECVFSKSGSKVTPNRAKLSHRLLESLVFARCSLASCK